ncbi:hypothetical protein [Acinetobacter pittii]
MLNFLNEHFSAIQGLITGLLSGITLTISVQKIINIYKNSTSNVYKVNQKNINTNGGKVVGRDDNSWN